MRVAAVVESLERDLELLCLTGVEDKLQDQVRPTLELLRNAGIRIWMLTGRHCGRCWVLEHMYMFMYYVLLQLV